MKEVLDGVYHWTAVHPRIRVEVSSYYVEPAKTLIDPMAPPEILEWLSGLAERPERIVITNRHHYRDSDRLRSELGCPVLCHRAGLHEFQGGPEVEGFAFGDDLGPGVKALEVGVICEEETALLLDADDGALAIADGLVNYDGLGFVSDHLLGENAELTKRGLRDAYARLLDHPFEALLPAHGDPLPKGKAALRDFIDSGRD